MPDKKNKVDKKTWIIRILQILEHYSDKDHGLSVARIVELLEKDYEIRADRKTVRRTLEELEKLDYKRIEYFMKAAEMNLQEALDVLSYIYKKGNSVVEKDLEKAFDYAQKAYTELKNQG